jgi:hypothetical protein
MKNGMTEKQRVAMEALEAAGQQGVSLSEGIFAYRCSLI